MSTAIATERELSSDQQIAADAIRDWLSGRRHELVVSGEAGSGKSTLIASMFHEMNQAKVLFLAPSAKACYVLNHKNPLMQACTVHSAIYLFSGVRERHDGNEQPIFAEREGFSDKLPFVPNLVCCDEGGMLGQREVNEIRSKGLGLMLIGDGFQLPPISEDPHLMDNPDVQLTTIHRQGAESPILNIARHVRLGGNPSAKFASENDQGSVAVIPNKHNRLTAQYAIQHGYDQIIVAYNRTRMEINKAMRFSLRKRGMLDEGDKLICRFNARRLGILNGMQFKVMKIADEDGISFICDLRIDLGGGELGSWRYGVRIQKKSLGNPDYKTSEREDGCVDMDYGYAITCHSSQGSSWRNVLVCYENCKNWSMARWGYTALTRAEKGLGVVVV